MPRLAGVSSRSGRNPGPSSLVVLVTKTIRGSLPAACREHTSPTFSNSGAIFARAAGLEDVRIHDFRHSLASRALALGANLTMIGKLFRYGDFETTARYAHLEHDSIHETAARIAERVAIDVL